MREESHVLIGQSFVGEGAEAAHVNAVLGDEVLATTPRQPDGDDIGAVLLASVG